MTLSDRIKAQAQRLGFQSVGILPVAAARTHAFYTRWLQNGYAGEMAYLHRHATLKANPASVEPSARSVIVLTYNYNRGDAAPAAGLTGRISRYAWGRDYHADLKDKLAALAGFIEQATEAPLTARPAVDSAPIMERELAAMAGLGWVGKNANLIHWNHGSWLFLAELLVDLELDYDRPRPAAQHRWPPPQPPLGAGGPSMMESCGSCTACIDACPTDAIVADKTVDSRRCISYLTIELKGAIPIELRPGIGDWVFGCDICQTVCPWNQRTPNPSRDTNSQPDGSQRNFTGPSLPVLLAMDREGFRAAYRGTVIERTKRRGLLRNAAVALGNLLHGKGPGRIALSLEERRQAHAALGVALGDSEPLVRGAAAWSLGQAALGHGARQPRSGQLLESALAREEHPQVRCEIKNALNSKASEFI